MWMILKIIIQVPAHTLLSTIKPVISSKLCVCKDDVLECPVHLNTVEVCKRTLYIVGFRSTQFLSNSGLIRWPGIGLILSLIWFDYSIPSSKNRFYNLTWKPVITWKRSAICRDKVSWFTWKFLRALRDIMNLRGNKTYS